MATRGAPALLVLLAGCAALPFSRARTPTSPPRDGYQLVWSDEFDRDGPPDPTKWTFETGFVRNDEAQWYQPENARVENGRLVIEARRERRRNPHFEPGSGDWRREREFAEYTSASLTTRGLHAWRYGRFEMRARIPVRAGAWPAFWTVGESGRWPASGEIDIMEYYRGMLLANAAWADTAGRAAWASTRTPIAELGGERWAERFHVWRMDWDERAIRISVDRRLLAVVPLDNTWNRDGDGRNPLRQPHHLILDLAIGGTQGGDPSASAFPMRYEIDWVRVYQRPGADSPAAP